VEDIVFVRLSRNPANGYRLILCRIAQQSAVTIGHRLMGSIDHPCSVGIEQQVSRDRITGHGTPSLTERRKLMGHHAGRIGGPAEPYAIRAVSKIPVIGREILGKKAQGHQQPRY
jgi:hypothetical protein